MPSYHGQEIQEQCEHVEGEDETDEPLDYCRDVPLGVVFRNPECCMGISSDSEIW